MSSKLELLIGVDYAYTMAHKAPERVEHGETVGQNPAV